jgi:hypothetical protein
MLRTRWVRWNKKICAQISPVKLTPQATSATTGNDCARS